VFSNRRKRGAGSLLNSVRNGFSILGQGSRINGAEVTVALKLNQGVSRKRAGYRFRGSFLFLFGQAKRKEEK
jgi:hypothetical protein